MKIKIFKTSVAISAGLLSESCNNDWMVVLTNWPKYDNNCLVAAGWYCLSKQDMPTTNGTPSKGKDAFFLTKAPKLASYSSYINIIYFNYQWSK